LAARLVAYATTPPRGAVSVLLGLAVLSGLMAAGVLPGYDPAVTGTVVLAVAAGVALVFAVVFERLRGADPAPADVARTERFHGLGLSLAMLSGVLLVAASASSLLVLDHPGSRQLAADRGAHATLYTRGSNSLKYRYAPVLAFTHDEKWAPTYVDSYVDSASARVVRRDGSEASPGHYKCSSLGPRSCLRITIDCASAADACSQALPQHDYGEHETSGAVYVRTLRRPGEDDPSDDAVALRGVFRSANDVARRTDILLQYWLFYPYDEWTTKVLGARLIQRHEGDWEAVTVGLDSNEKPLFVAYSAHCGGTWKRWKDTERFASHPLVAVAEGSHANYADSGAKRPPDFTSCKRLPRGIGTLLGFAANVRDVTSDDWQWGAAEVIRVTAKDWPMNFPGTWGGHDITQLTNARTFTSPLGGGPPSPPLQHLWQEPVKTIFCDRYWDGPEPCRER
jgi:hypothetical protein